MAAQVGGKCAAAVQIKELLAASAGDKKGPLRELYWQWLSAQDKAKWPKAKPAPIPPAPIPRSQLQSPPTGPTGGVQSANTLTPKLEAADESDDGPNGFTNQLVLLCDSVSSGRGYAACLLSNEFGIKATLRLAEPHHYKECGIPMGHAVLLHKCIFPDLTK